MDIAAPKLRTKLFRYRFVGYGTQFTPAAGLRAPDDHANPSALYENELAVDVGGRAYGTEGENAPILDHHFVAAGSAPCAAAAVLHRAEAIRARFAGNGAEVVWLVAHRDPDFDAFAAMYLARWLIEEDEQLDWRAHGIDARGWYDVEGEHGRIRRIDWFSPLVGARCPPRFGWAVQLAGYAACVDHARRIYCARNEALHSVLYAALSRGRPYYADENGALEFFNEVRARLIDGANPHYDSVLANSPAFAPELAMLARENEHYERDLARARTGIVFVPVGPPDFAAAYARTCAAPLRDEGDGEPSELGQGAERRAVDGVYLRDPECLLFKEWARIDERNSSLGQGFSFTCVAYSARDDAPPAYYVSLDPDPGRRLHLYPVWERLQRAEIAALRAANADPRARPPRSGFEARAGGRGALFTDPWYDGASYECTIVVSPNAGTALGPAGTRADLLDDPVAALVRAELESWAYAGALQRHDEPPAYRFASVTLNDAVDVLNDALAAQVATRLWCALFDAPDTAPMPEHARAHVFRRHGLLAVWGRRGAAVAYVRAEREAAERLEGQFTEIVTLARGLDAVCGGAAEDLPARVKAGEELMTRMGRLRRELAADDGEVIEGFIDEAGFERVLETFRDVNHAETLGLQTKQVIEHARVVADVQVKVEWLELLFVAIYATEVGHIIADALVPKYTLIFTMLCSVVVTAGAAWYLRPWESEVDEKRRGLTRPFLAGGALIVLLGIVLGFVQAGWVHVPPALHDVFRPPGTP
ncbi:MAG: hypothetical protein JO036_21160 [Candidatus Eremiobacteraeota bacterium]|nr:hypothetical protein [Candidatus Eremiobacteraeota bacterium]